MREYQESFRKSQQLQDAFEAARTVSPVVSPNQSQPEQQEVTTQETTYDMPVTELIEVVEVTQSTQFITESITAITGSVSTKIIKK